MKNTQRTRFGVKSQACLAAVSALVLAAPSPALAAPAKLTDSNSSLVINPTSDQLMTTWLVDGVSQLVLQSFYLRVGSVGGESALSTLPLISQSQPTANTLNVLYGNAMFSIETSYSLVGGSSGSGVSSVSEQVKITNLSGSALDFHFFQYADFDLAGSSANDTVQLGKNIQGFYNEALQFKPSNLGTVDTVLTSGANHGQVSSFPTILNSLNDGAPTTLNDNSGPMTGDATWAFQWDRLIAAGDSFIIGIDKNLYLVPIPEPSIFALGALGAAFMAMKRRNR
ncbi:MAG TPA: PEP-CTERM sorting domain-containing protein [Verrucomicrobiae bacterium]|nr:PEP-CTERM sorting domain-containing protein [Verrucomicrobiae bacterium]